MVAKKTSFGSLEPLLIRKGKVVSELATFHSDGKSHIHDQWEICYVLSGRGHIKVEGSKCSKTYAVRKGNMVKIPPDTGHWMEVKKGGMMEILLVYSDMAEPENTVTEIT